MTAAPELTADERARVAAFDAAPVLVESSEMTRAMLALAEELAYKGDLTPWQEGGGPDPYEDGLDTAAARIRATVAAVLAADPEPREQS